MLNVREFEIKFVYQRRRLDRSLPGLPSQGRPCQTAQLTVDGGGQAVKRLFISVPPIDKTPGDDPRRRFLAPA
jgi:hypothetical protein